jgi:DNA-binding NarL/FixJ family response regulator
MRNLRKEGDFGVYSRSRAVTAGSPKYSLRVPEHGSQYKMPLRILLVDNHKIMTEGIRALLEQSGGFAVVGEAGDKAEALAICNQILPDMIVMDIGLPGMNRIETLQLIVRNAPGIKVVILSMYGDEHSVVSAIRAGAQAYVLKQAASSDLLEAIRTVAAGGCYLSPDVSERLLRSIKRVGPESPPALQALSPRELQVFRLAAAGNASKDIAVTLNLAVVTVRSYRKTMMKKLGVSNVAGVTRVAFENGVVLGPCASMRRRADVE